MNYKKPDIFPFGEHAILIKWEEKIDENLLNFILSVKKSILQNNTKVIVEVIHTYNSLLIEYNISIKNIYSRILAISDLILNLKQVSFTTKTLYHLPVCYEEKFALDLPQIAKENKLDLSEIKALHTAPTYTVFSTGFLPGFLYIGGLEKDLFFPRKKSPRKRVKKGAVGIAGNQTGIYPKSSPGGWQIIGNCPLDFFDTNKNPPSVFKPGDKIKFYPITIKEHGKIVEQVKSGNFEIKSEKHEA